MSWAGMAPLAMVVIAGGVAAMIAGEERRARARRLARVEVPRARRRPPQAGAPAGRPPRGPAR
jgi:hypothetical protein